MFQKAILITKGEYCPLDDEKLEALENTAFMD